jgi:DNA polymerase-3 subunit beta
MKIAVGKHLFSRIMSHATGTIEKKQTIPILGHVLLSASGSYLSVTSTNMDMTLIDTAPCDVIEGGSCCISAHLLFDITRKASDNSPITIQHNGTDNSISVLSAKSSFSLNHIDSSEFPPIPEDDYGVSFEMDTSLFKESIDISKVAMLQDNSRFHLNGIHIHHENVLGTNNINFVATDLYRIACVAVPSPEGAIGMPPIIVSKKAITEILKLLDDTEAASVLIKISNSRILIVIEDENMKTEFSSRLVSGNFPEYKSALSVSNDKILTTRTEDLVSAIERVRTVVVDSTNSVQLSIHPEKVVVSGVSKELGKAVDEVEANFNFGEPMKICFNSKYLLELLNQIESDEVKMTFAGSSSSSIISPLVQSPSSIFAIMPIELLVG